MAETVWSQAGKVNRAGNRVSRIACTGGEIYNIGNWDWRQIMKRYGVKITMPEDDPLRAEHLLGSDWASTHWFKTPRERDEWIEGMQHEHPYSRRGDIPSQRYEKINRE